MGRGAFRVAREERHGIHRLCARRGGGTVAAATRSARGLGRTVHFKGTEYILGARHYRLWNAGNLRNMNAITAIGGAGKNAMQEHNVALPFAHGNVQVANARDASGEISEFVVVRCKERPRAGGGLVFGDRPCQTESVEGAGSAADFVKHYE